MQISHICVCDLFLQVYPINNDYGDKLISRITQFLLDEENMKFASSHFSYAGNATTIFNINY